MSDAVQCAIWVASYSEDRTINREDSVVSMTFADQRKTCRSSDRLMEMMKAGDNVAMDTAAAVAAETLGSSLAESQRPARPGPASAVSRHHRCADRSVPRVPYTATTSRRTNAKQSN